jgi:ATP-dependent exoDNAse (exonuclease V) alpha subunit
LFDRNSVALECQLWQQALERGRGENFSVDELKEFTRRRPYIRNSERPAEVTLREVLLREIEIVQTVKDGAGNCRPLLEHSYTADPNLDGEQRLALDTLLRSINAVSLFRGGAGTGKSFVLGELVRQVRQSGKSVVVLAPQRQQVVAMEQAGFLSPTTVTSFLLKNELVEGAVVVVDEAGQIGGRQMSELLRLARKRNARVLLSGDTRQHGAVEASDALLAIERHSGVKPVELHAIRRQDPALGRSKRESCKIKQYRKAVEVAAAGKLAESFERLNKMGAVVSCRLGEQADKLADEYVRLAEEKASAVVVSQTWAEVHRINFKVRDALKGKGLLGANDVTVEALDKLDLTNAQKRDQRFYSKDAVIVFNQKVRQAEQGKRGKLAGIIKAGVLVEVDGKCVTISNKVLDKITVCLPREISVAQGDKLHLKANRKLASGDRVTNGELVTVKSALANGKIELTDGRTLDKSFREFLPGYAVTSYGSQGKTVDYVLFSDSTIKAATNAQQWYVTISRGRRGVRIFTPDKEQLRENLSRSGHRPLALEFAGNQPQFNRNPFWGRLHGYLLRFGQHAVNTFCRLKQSRRHSQSGQKHEHQNARMLHH